MSETLCLTSDQIVYAVGSAFDITIKAVWNFFYIGVAIGIIAGVGIGLALAYYWTRRP